MKALLLAAGYATRLYPLTLDKPKPLLAIGPQPIIDYIVKNIERSQAINEIFVVTNHKFYGNFKQWAGSYKGPLPISVIDDGTLSNEDRLGAVGDIGFAIKDKDMREGLLVIGADNIFDAELGDFIKFAVSKGSASSVGLYDVADKKLATKYGVVSIDAKGKVIDFQEKPSQPKSTLISTCIYYFPSTKLGLFDKYLNESANAKKDASGNYITWLSKNDSVYGCVLKGRWYDIGDTESYKKADNDFKRVPCRMSF